MNLRKARKRKPTEAEVDAALDRAARFVAEAVAAGATVTVGVAPCPRCGAEERYQSNSSPDWINRWTSPHCGRHESR